MRMKRSRIRTANLRRKTVTKDSEGVPCVIWGEAAQLKCEIWPAGGQLQSRTYGDRVNNMLNVKVMGAFNVIDEDGHEAYRNGDTVLSEGDGLCVYRGPNDEPDYRIISIRPYTPLRLEVERL